ncbi:MAG TPA: hypothetical protein PLI09_03035 [Candidatus Hydrogenedentes bacterium]|nr:hypothetical protein [Candidatus Hydrogenedentota bacterium]
MYRKHLVLYVLVALFACVLMNGCAWQRIKPEMRPTTTSALPIKVGVQLSNSPASGTYGPPVVAKLREYNTFQSISFPYHDGDDVDGVITLDIAGGWKSNAGANFGKGFLIGLTFFTLSPAIGPSMTGNHSVSAAINRAVKEVARYQTNFKTKVTWGMLANTTQVAQKADALQVSKIASFLSESIQNDWPKISTEFKK